MGRKGEKEGKKERERTELLFSLLAEIRQKARVSTSNSNAMHCQFLYYPSCFKHLILPIIPIPISVVILVFYLICQWP